MSTKQEIPIKHAARFIIAPLLDSLVTCVGRDGKPNIIEISLFGKDWGNPTRESDESFGVYHIMVHPARYSHKLIKETGEFIINIPTVDIVEKSWYCGSHSGRSFDKFKETNLTPVPAKYVKAPLIKECPINIECKVVETVEPRYSAYTYFFGKALAIHADEGVWDGNMVNIDKCPMTLPVLAGRIRETEYRAPGKVIFKGSGNKGKEV